ncbi:hypothetical protein Q8F55_002638 [Vanrija albida]|uniref:GDP/GTP exchange factor Sec2 N-terminal domain-containing protein n=1 Tax=Vanrija albida TaxID=181172 RepID=A0ABR3QAF9_9TREE
MTDTTEQDKQHAPDEPTEAKDAGADATAPDASNDDDALAPETAAPSTPPPVTTKEANDEAKPESTPEQKRRSRGASPSKIKRRPVPTALGLEGTSYADGPSIEVSSAATIATLSRAAEVEKNHAPDSPTTSLIAALRSQLEIVSEQALQLNSKLVASISRHADLEDTVYTLEGERREQNERVDELEREKSRWEESMNTGLLVERAQIRDEMQRLAAGLVEEERRRGSAEERRAQVENEVDDLAATLFDQANTMVATERMSRAQAEERLKESEDNLAAAEAAVRDMQLHLQSLSTPAAESPGGEAVAAPRHILSSHPPYAEFTAFVQHMRAARPRKIKSRDLYPAPATANLLTHPFLVRALAEDHEPTLRLDAAPELSWLSRRSVGSAVISGDLLVEPVNAAALGPPEHIKCAMCGSLVFGAAAQGQGARLAQSRFSLKPFFSSPGTHVNSALASSTSVYVFRVATGAEKDAKAYPLCKNGWCLERLRAACALWHFVRTGIVQSLWFSEDVTHSRNPSAANAADIVAAANAPTTPAGGEAAADDGTPRPVDLSRTPPDADKLSLSPAPPALPERPTASAQRKSGWGLGFKWSRNTPPTTPGPETPKESTFAALIATGPDAKAAEALGAPINLGVAEEEQADRKGKGKEKAVEEVEPEKEVEAVKEEKAEVDDGAAEAEKTEDKVEKVDEVEKSDEADDDKDKADDDKDKADDDKDKADETEATTDAPKADNTDDTVLSRSDSHTGSEADTASFTTPHNEPADLPEEAGEKKAESEEPAAKEEASAKEEESDSKEEAAEKPEDKTSDDDKPADDSNSSSPVVTPPKSDSPPPTAPKRSAARGAAPPPLPKRAAARNRNSAALSSPPDTPTEARHADAKADSPVEEPETPTTATATEAPTTGNSAATLVESTSDARVPPPLPPRHPRTPLEGRASSEEMPPPPLPVPRTEKTFVTGDGWEARTWRQVIKLKEDMWRARVGVVDESE